MKQQQKASQKKHTQISQKQTTPFLPPPPYSPPLLCSASTDVTPQNSLRLRLRLTETSSSHPLFTPEYSPIPTFLAMLHAVFSGDRKVAKKKNNNKTHSYSHQEKKERKHNTPKETPLSPHLPHPGKNLSLITTSIHCPSPPSTLRPLTQPPLLLSPSFLSLSPVSQPIHATLAPCTPLSLCSSLSQQTNIMTSPTPPRVPVDRRFCLFPLTRPCELRPVAAS